MLQNVVKIRLKNYQKTNKRFFKNLADLSTVNIDNWIWRFTKSFCKVSWPVQELLNCSHVLVTREDGSNPGKISKLLRYQVTLPVGHTWAGRRPGGESYQLYYCYS